jgi:putative ATP-binding cassette transporter
MSVIGQNFLYVMLAVLIFALPAVNATDAQNVVQVTSALIFIMGPLGDVVGSVPLLMRSSTAIAIIEELESTLDKASPEKEEIDPAEEAKLHSFREISLRNVSFAYESRSGEGTFRLGPLNLNLKSNELLFIIGGNGSGKSTMMKVLTGLYANNGGSILVDNTPITPEDLAAYRSLFSIIFTDFHLFDRFYGMEDIDQDVVNKLIVDMRLQDVTSIENSKFKNIHLSTGQRKRLALIVALLEQRPILVFDEVAADQDPGFRKYFYETFLHRLKSEGKTIIAVTHDDHYFHVADRVMKMEDGKLTEYTR